ncbi:MAG: alginate O-acetyltransferase complex protein AlgI [Akkermansiaceae bacterium]|jgi:alginate O-acetyltransferase complex protein AlgI
MLFTTLEFALLVAVTFSLFYIVRNVSAQVGILLAASIIFYAVSSPWLTLLLLASAIFTSWASYEIYKAETARKRKIIACIGVILNLSLLVFFKYAGLLVGSIENLMGTSLLSSEWIVILPLPIGISFYTFQGISMLVDTFRDSSDAPQSSQVYGSGESLGKSLYYGSFYVIFFPQLVAGPVVKAKDFFPQIRVKLFSEINWRLVVHSLIVGYFLKLVVANNLQNQTFWIKYPYIIGMSADRAWTLLIGYSCQIFADFSGYSLIAIGIAALFGYRLPDNFNFPYLSASVAEFWRRWHISLSSWLKDYLYIPLGGNRKGSIRTYLNLLIVMVLGGLWHGAAWSYLIWGAYHGLLLGMERAMGRAGSRMESSPNFIWTWMRYGAVFLLVSLGWSFFKLPDITHAGLFIFQAFTAWEGALAQKKEIIVVAVYCLPVFLYHLNSKLEFTKHNPRFVPVAYGLMLYAIIVNSASADAFIYFQF